MPKDWFQLLCDTLKAMNPLRALQMALAAKDGVNADKKAQLLAKLEKFARILEEKVAKTL